MSREVTCVDIDDSSNYDDCRCIESIGYKITSGGRRYSSTPEEIHDDIENNGKTYYVRHSGQKTYLEAAEKGSTRYVRTEANDTEDDNLLQQPSC